MSMWAEDEGEGAPAFLQHLANHRRLAVVRGGKPDARCDRLLRQIHQECDDDLPMLFPRLEHLRIVDVPFDPVLLVHIISSRQHLPPNTRHLPADPEYIKLFGHVDQSRGTDHYSRAARARREDHICWTGCMYPRSVVRHHIRPSGVHRFGQSDAVVV
ncbi:hypothetical protein BDV98DRAFT_282309 [Pterulicium gracile]|uniref:Uncharacterized protein n=1 Tax=Pterulicium gracile TaxID=1884261 RepID=A0A5C3R2S0_9AGAR|nr:hypothetical protein BDV98DRAFT_282309 [Pterula gracilis]